MDNDNFHYNKVVLYIIQNDNSDKPIKVCFEDTPLDFKTVKYKPTIREVLTDILNSRKAMMSLTTQQAKSEKGKIRKGNYSEVINFLAKRGVDRDFIDNEMSKERDVLTFTQKLGVSLLDIDAFGYFELD